MINRLLNDLIEMSLDNDYKSIEFKTPGKRDAAGIWELVRESPPLDLNSFYSYLLLCTHYRDTCVVGKLDEIGRAHV